VSLGKNKNGARVREILSAADAGGFAVPAFNYSDIWDFLAIAEAAEDLDAPVFVSSTLQVVSDIGIELCAAFVAAKAKKVGFPLIHHLDHSDDVSVCIEAVDNGYPSVMMDASAQPLAENIREVKQVVEYAKVRGVVVEGEVGRIKGRGSEGSHSSDVFLARVADIEQFVAESGVDSLAPAIGTAHGFYEGKPEIQFRLLAEINKAVKVPLVLHGGTGIPEEDVRLAIKNGINKVNVGTEIACGYMNAVRKELMERGENAFTFQVMNPARAAVREVVNKWIRVCMADGKAKSLIY